MPGFLTCGPNEALVVSGCCLQNPTIVPGGRVFVWPFIQRAQKLTLNTMTLSIESPKVYTQQGVPISVTGIAQVKIQGQNMEMLRAACEQFLGKTSKQIMDIAKETLEGHQRAIMCTMSVEEIYKDRKKFSKQVFEVASSDLINMGITVVSYTIKDISDDQGYLKSLGMSRTAQVKRDARIGEAEARRDSQIKEALAEEERMAARYVNDTEIAKAQRDFELKKAAYDMEVNTKRAESDLAFNLQAAKTRQKIKEEQMQVKVIERAQEIQVQEQEILRRERELEATVRRPAEAEKYRLEKLAEANRNRVIMEAEAEAEAIRLRGEAEAFAVEAKAKAEAEQMAKKADAFKEYRDAAMVDMVLDTLPKIAAEVAAPLTQCNRVVMVSDGKGDMGAGKLTGEVLDIIANVPHVVSKLTGVNITNSLKVAQAAT
ncbi:flotillin-1 isoform X1 [Parasteatoda tepidariorum]|uniref:flotillin-1 isoform X1 n=2 Tax=Parasteatoda tepidariorum TaxID=114398 RepID=UPI00077FD1A1|nr:flotillin-1 isoform X1 [Parasteatoda tepidariorum]